MIVEPTPAIMSAFLYEKVTDAEITQEKYNEYLKKYKEMLYTSFLYTSFDEDIKTTCERIYELLTKYDKI